ncbi:hypothetical protein ACIRST_39615 [Kitasatospora sp. NPDC101447]|uniref:hypothetical protein n=1 Tax=Kitasatospora sp. NPDC101447 TaxID=3364102 RepID=UPI003827306D
MADTDDKQASAQVWGAAAVVASALAVVTAYLINGALLVLAVAGVETLLLMVYVGRRWRALHSRPSPAGHRPRRGSPDAAHCERCRRAREALDARQARTRTRAVRPEPSAPSAPRSSAGRPADREQHERDERRAGQEQHEHPDHHEHPEQHEGQAHHEDRAHREHPEPAAQPEPGAADHLPYLRRPQARAPYERPWTAERAAARSVDRSTARRGAPGSAGRAVRHQ